MNANDCISTVMTELKLSASQVLNLMNGDQKTIDTVYEKTKHKADFLAWINSTHHPLPLKLIESKKQIIKEFRLEYENAVMDWECTHNESEVNMIIPELIKVWIDMGKIEQIENPTYIDKDGNEIERNYIECITTARNDGFSKSFHIFYNGKHYLFTLTLKESNLSEQENKPKVKRSSRYKI